MSVVLIVVLASMQCKKCVIGFPLFSPLCMVDYMKCFIIHCQQPFLLANQFFNVPIRICICINFIITELSEENLQCLGFKKSLLSVLLKDKLSLYKQVILKVFCFVLCRCVTNLNLFDNTYLFS